MYLTNYYMKSLTEEYKFPKELNSFNVFGHLDLQLTGLLNVL